MSYKDVSSIKDDVVPDLLKHQEKRDKIQGSLAL
mgnify:FL=1